MMSVIRPWIPAVLVLALAAAALLIPGTKANPPYQFLHDRTQATDDQQRFLNNVVAYEGVTQDQLDLVLPRIRRVGSDLPVLLELSRQSGRPLHELVEMRRSGKSWQQIRDALDLPVKALFTDVTGRFPEPYKESWVEWRMKRKPEFGDEQVRDLMMLELAHRVTGKPKEDIVRERAKGRTPETMIAQMRTVPKAEEASPKPAVKAGAKSKKAAPGARRSRGGVRAQRSQAPAGGR